MYKHIPGELKQLPQWVMYRAEKRDGKITKVPYTIQGKRASTTNPEHWTSYERAYEVFSAANNHFSGLGFVFTSNDPYVGIDLDNCVIDGKEINEQAKTWLMKLNSYTERSQSGNGVHAIVKATLPAKGCRRSDLGIEIYQEARFFVMTGNHVKGTPETIEERQEIVDTILDEITKKNAPVTARTVKTPSHDADHDIIARALKAANREKFKRLFEGDTSLNNDDDSAADLALCNMIAFYTKDPEQIDRIFRMSGLMRDKWERDDYREQTINKALESVVHISYPLTQSNRFNDEWDEFDLYVDVPQEWNERLPEEALYGLAGDVVRLIEPHSEADPAALLINFLTMFGNLVGSNPHFVAGGAAHYMKLFAVLVGKSFEGKKGSSLPPVISLFEAVDVSFTERKKTGLSSGEGVIHLVRDAVYQTREVREGNKKNGKPTGEVETVLVDSGVEDKRLLLIEPEFGGVLNAMKREGNKLSAIMREAWDGAGDLGVITKNPIKATNTHISILGHITPEELAAKMNETEVHNGFVNRFLWLYVKRSKSLPSGGNFHNVDVGDIVQRITDAVEYGQNCGLITRDEEANALWEAVYSKLEKDAPGLIGTAISRAIPYVMRLACIYALLDRTNMVSSVHLKSALALWSYCRKSATFIFGKQEQYDPMVERILNGLQDAPNGLTATEISAKIFSRNVDKKEITSCLGKMQKMGKIVIETIHNGGRGRPKQIIKLNELIEC